MYVPGAVTSPITLTVMVRVCPTVIRMLELLYRCPNCCLIFALAADTVSPAMWMGPKPSTVIIPSGDTSSWLDFWEAP